VEIGIINGSLALLWPVFAIAAFVEAAQGFSAYFINKNRS